jgi:hypothetical protein
VSSGAAAGRPRAECANELVEEATISDSPGSTALTFDTAPVFARFRAEADATATPVGQRGVGKKLHDVEATHGSSTW